MHESRHILEVKKKQIETNLTALFQQVETVLSESMNCLTTRDLSLCESLVRGDLSLNELRRVVEQDCLVAIASQQPVAHDLRDIVADMRIASELERMGDYASDIASSIMRMDAASLDKVKLDDIMAMSKTCQQMLASVIQAHEKGDATLARSIQAMDDQLDASMSRVIDALMDVMRADQALVNNGSRMLWIAHNLERCGDRATNIAEQVVFRVEGETVDLS